MKFKVGEIYKDKRGDRYKFIANVPEAATVSCSFFVSMETGEAATRDIDGRINPPSNNAYDILPPEKKTVKMYPALSRELSTGRDYSLGYYVTNTLHDTCPEYAIRLIAEYPPVEIEI